MEQFFWRGYISLSFILKLFFCFVMPARVLVIFKLILGSLSPLDDEDVKYDLNGTNMGLIWIVTKSKLYEKF